MIGYVKPSPEEAQQLRAHIRDAHPNLLGYPDTWIGYAPLPRSGLSEVPDEWLFAIHCANHNPLYRDHLDDQWLPAFVPAGSRREEAL
jgi:hypothetical protein